MSKEKILEEFDKTFEVSPFYSKYISEPVKEYNKVVRKFIEKAIDQTREEIKKDLIKIADAGEYEDLRREVEYYFK